MAMTLHIRLNDSEARQVEKMLQNEFYGFENVSEFIRYLIAVEANRRSGLPRPGGSQFSTAFRTGRPVVSGK